MLTNNNLKTELNPVLKNHSCNTTKIKSWIKALCLYPTFKIFIALVSIAIIS
jgi:hypothetical protein